MKKSLTKTGFSAYKARHDPLSAGRAFDFLASRWLSKYGSSQRHSGMAETREVMDIHEASQYLGVSRETLYKYVWEERIPAFKLGNRWKFKKTVLDRWMEKQSTEHDRRPRRRAQGLARQGA